MIPPRGVTDLELREKRAAKQTFCEDVVYGLRAELLAERRHDHENR